MRAISVDSATLTVMGFKYDRKWMIVDEGGMFLTQRDLPELATIRVNISDENLTLTNKTGDSFSIPVRGNKGKVIETKVWGSHCEGVDQGDHASNWLTAVLGKHRGKHVRLLRFRDEFRREVEKEYLQGEEAHTAFADGYPFLITAEESLTMLNDRLVNSGSQPVTMDRFRPNIVIKGLNPFQENKLDQLNSADGRFSLGIRKPCKRCKVTTVDQESGAIAEPKEPLKTLTRMKTVPERHGAYFGQNATLLKGEGEAVKTGDQLDVVWE